MHYDLGFLRKFSMLERGNYEYRYNRLAGAVDA